MSRHVKLNDYHECDKFIANGADIMMQETHDLILKKHFFEIEKRVFASGLRLHCIDTSVLEKKGSEDATMKVG